MSNGMGISEISWQEIAAWQAATQQHSIWLAETVKMLSRVFVSSFHQYDGKPLGASPLDDEISEEAKQAALDKQISDFIKR